MNVIEQILVNIVDTETIFKTAGIFFVILLSIERFFLFSRKKYKK